MAFRRAWLSILALGLLSPPALLGQDDEDADFPPGLRARYAAGARTVERVVGDVAFDWETAAPDPRLPAGRFEAEWSGRLLIRKSSRYRFHVHALGEAVVEIDGREVLSGCRESAGWISGEEIELGFGEKALRVKFRKTEEAASIGLFWSSEYFPLEPVPAHLLFRDETRPESARIERGRIAYDAHRCNRCHRRANEPLAPTGPALTHLAAGTSSEWLVAKIQDPQADSAHEKMPSFGFTADEARAVAAFLVANSREIDLAKADRPKDLRKERREGEILFRSVGCLACHTAGEHGADGPYGGGDLSRIGQKRSIEWLLTWLRAPERFNADHRMPVFKLSGAERRRLAVYLASLGVEKKRATSSRKEPKEPGRAAPDRADTARLESSHPARLSIPRDEDSIRKGRKLVEAARCANCHRIEGVEPDFAGIPDLAKPPRGWSKSCLAESPDRKRHRPAYRGIDRDTLIAFVKSRAGTLSPESRFAHGRRVLEQRNCLGCHERGDSKGIVETAGLISRLDENLRGQSEGLIPPALTAVGDKLLDEALAEAVSGEQNDVRLAWLRVRMPRFRHSDDEKGALLHYLISHDRIPDAAPRRARLAATRRGALPSGSRLNDKGASAQALVVGQQLIGVGGFSCIACHQVGEYEPKNVALGTRGSDLMHPGRRMRKSFFLRWTRSPLRIVPGMEMPSYERPVPAIFDEKIDAQLAAVWDALNDPRFKPPTNPTAVEQLLVVQADEPARVVRDVFTNPKENGGGYVARAMAIGLNNGHNVLYDLDTFSVRGWHFGDFARQRSEGKSWYWDMAGIPVISGFGPESDFALRRRAETSGELIAPKREEGTNGRLRGYRRDGPGVQIEYELDFEIDGKRRKATVRESIQPVLPGDEGRSGWERTIRLEGAALLKEFDVVVSHPRPKATLGAPAIEAVADTSGPSGNDTGETFPLTRTSEGACVTTLRYRCSLERTPLAEPPAKTALVPAAEKVTSVPGFDGIRLPIDRSIMPTAITWTSDGRLAFTSLKGHVYTAKDTDGDGLEETLTVFEEGLAAPYGIIADGDDLIVAHKPELIRLRDTDGDGRADQRTVLASGWGHTDNYHDWTCGIVRDDEGNLYVGLGSDYAQPDRPQDKARWRGKVLRISPRGEITPIGHSFRYPTGLVIDGAGEIFVSDNQGVQNTFNEINHLVEGKHYGVPSRYETDRDAPAMRPAIQVPHPWTRSVNGLFFLPDSDRRAGGVSPPIRGDDPKQVGGLTPPARRLLAGHGIGCEYNNRLLVRFTTQKVGETMQGAAYYFSRPDAGAGGENFSGPLCGAVSPKGDLYIGSIHDSGWVGGRNTGEIVRLRPGGNLPNGIRELRATADGFEVEFFRPVDPKAAAVPENYTISGYTRIWKGAYATPDSGRHKVTVESVEISADARTVRLRADGLRTGHVYDVSVRSVGTDGEALWPDTGHYTLHRIPGQEPTGRNK